MTQEKGLLFITCLNLMLLLGMVCFPTPVHKLGNCIEDGRDLCIVEWILLHTGSYRVI